MPTKRRQIKKKTLTNRKRNTQKKTKRNRNNRKFRTRYTKKNVGGGDWIDNDTIPKEDVCPICLQQFSETPELAVYETTCGHKFHNNCLNRVCDSARAPRCPICRSELEKAAIGNEPARADCKEVYAFASKALDNPDFLDEKNRAIYDAQPELVENDNEEPGIFEQPPQGAAPDVEPHGAVPDVGDIPHNNDDDDDDDDDIGPVMRIPDDEEEE